MKIAIVNPITKTVDMPEKKTSILGLSPSRSKTDSETNIMELASKISDGGHEVTVYVSDAYEPEEPPENVNGKLHTRYLKTKYKNAFPPAYIPYTPELVDEILSNSYDIVQSGEFFQWGTILASRSTRKCKIPLVVWQEIDINPQFPGGFLQSAYNLTYGRIIRRRITTFVPRSKSARIYLLDIGIPPEAISPVIHTGVNTEIFHPMEDQNLKEKFGLKPDTPLVLSVGRLHPNKGFDILLRAIAKVKERVPDIYLIIKGSGPQKSQLQELIKRLRLDKNAMIISAHISRRRMNELYNAADFTAISSRIDLFPFSAIESMACGKPVVSIYGRAVKHDVIGNHGTGICLPNDSLNEFADAIVYLIRHPEIRHEMCRKALYLCHKEFDLDVVSNRFCNIYNQLTSLENSK